MLKALELYGFKSFADRTKFEFPPGITVVVGPNGSGKSNIVDAIKWVLGAQSARALRGKDMSDVIFKGSGNGQRKPSNTAEATIIFDNTSGLLPIEGAEVHVTRRVYRSGESEFMINRQPCRLRDIKDSFRGTGLGTDAYSLIEQGKVDTLLQASPKDRRAIFEEAAGISRFKAKKVEAQRRLDRVEQNLLRLSDIVDEVDGRLRRLKSQATKARRFKEYNDRLQSLRTHVGRVDWSRLTTDLHAVEIKLAALAAEVGAGNADIEALEAQDLTLENEMAAQDTAIRELQAQSARVREVIAGDQSLGLHARSRLVELEEQTSRYRRQLLAMTSRAGDLYSKLGNLDKQIRTAEVDLDKHRQTFSQREAALAAIDTELDQVRRDREAKLESQSTYIRDSTSLANHIAAHQSFIQSTQTRMAENEHALAELNETVAAARQDRDRLDARRDELTADYARRGEALVKLRDGLGKTQRRLVQLRDELSETQHKRVAAAERATVIEEFEERLEGVDSGVRAALARATEEPQGPYGGIRGMVADLLEVPDPKLAPLVDVALGDRSQHLVVAGSRLIQHLQRDPCDLPGRVGFMRLESTAPPGSKTDLSGQSGIIGRADEYVVAPTEYHHLISWLLGDTWFVQTLADAVQFRNSLQAPARFVTRAGELLETDGRLFVGPTQGPMGLMSRRAELRNLQEQIERCDVTIEEQQLEIDELRQALEKSDTTASTLTQELDDVAAELSDVRASFEATKERFGYLVGQQGNLMAEKEAAKTKLIECQALLVADQEKLSAIEALLINLESALTALGESRQKLETQRKQHDAAVNAARVRFAKSEQQLEALIAQRDQLHLDQNDRERALETITADLETAEQKSLSGRQRILDTSSSLAELYLQDEAISAQQEQILLLQEKLREQRRRQSQNLQEVRRQIRSLEQQQHQLELDAEKKRLERTTLSNRLTEDYGINISLLEDISSTSPAVTDGMEDGPIAEGDKREQVDTEIGELRRKISNIGSVNMDALSELEELDLRYQTLSAQFHDLRDAKEKLQRIITKINVDSRRLFGETLEHIRANFRELFRKVFGGGRADIVLEEGVDVLDSGIDIVATPPGKNSLGISLLSGGERALTAVTLLLAIFQYRPSAFCVLDEVDGPLDEANIDRFVEVLGGFLDWTKFVVVTHSKKTMTAANTLYGVTMQESGVSKRVSVRFEDVSDDGHISSEALQRTNADGPDGDERGAA